MYVVAEVIAEVEKEMAGNGRVLVRPSGTEPLVRVMVEAPTEEECDVCRTNCRCCARRNGIQNKILNNKI